MKPSTLNLGSIATPYNAVSLKVKTVSTGRLSTIRDKFHNFFFLHNGFQTVEDECFSPQVSQKTWYTEVYPILDA
jgi:hypothetical protein